MRIRFLYVTLSKKRFKFENNLLFEKRWEKDDFWTECTKKYLPSKYIIEETDNEYFIQSKIYNVDKIELNSNTSTYTVFYSVEEIQMKHDEFEDGLYYIDSDFNHHCFDLIKIIPNNLEKITMIFEVAKQNIKLVD